MTGLHGYRHVPFFEFLRREDVLRKLADSASSRATHILPVSCSEVFPCFFLSCKANVRVKLAKTGHGPHSSKLVYFSLFPTRYTILFRLHTVSAILFPLHVSGLTGPSSGGLNCTCSLWYSPPLQMSLSCGR